MDHRGNVYVTDYSCGSGNGYQYYDYATIKYNARGEEQWVAYFDGPSCGMDVAKAIAVDKRGNVYVTGYSCLEDTDDGYCDFATVKYDARGREQWVAYYDGPGNGRDVPTSVALDEEGHVYVTGYWCRPNTGREGCDYGTVSYDRFGIQLSIVTESEPPVWDDVSQNVAMDRHGHVYVTAPSRDNAAPRRDYATNKQGKVPFPSDEALALISSTKDMNLPDMTEFRLIKTLEGVIKLLGRGGERQAIRRLEAFIGTVEALRDQGITSDQADALINAAGEIFDDIGPK